MMAFKFSGKRGAMKVFRKLGLAAVVLASAQAATAASVSNMDFESGNLAPWGGTGSVVNDAATAYQGDWYGQLVGSQSLFQTVSLVAGQKYDFMWRFIAGDYLPHNDASFVITDAGYNLLANVATVGDYGDSGWQYYSWVPNANYNGPLVFGVSNILNNGLNSKLLLDAAVPLPGAALLFGSALLGAGVLRRRRMAAKKLEMIAV